MDNHKKLSIIIPNYNKEKYIEECVLSVENQNINGIELIIVDDASTDNSYGICEALQKKYSNILLSRHKVNQGQEISRNDGLSLAKGEWVVFLDSDDKLNNEVCKIIEDIDSTIDIIMCDYCYFDDLQKAEKKTKLEDNQIYSSDEIAVKICQQILSWDCISCVGSKIYRREFIEKNQLFFNSTYKFNEDGGFIISALMKANQILYCEFCLYYYRNCFGGSMTGYRENAFQSVDRVNILLEEYLFRVKDVVDGTLFINKKRLSNLSSWTNNEIRYGSKKKASSFVQNILRDDSLKKTFAQIMDNGEYTQFEKDYVRAYKEGIEGFILTYARQVAMQDFYKRVLLKKETNNNLWSFIDANNVSIYGCGDIGRFIARDALRNGINVDCFIDKARYGEKIDGIKCISPDESFPKSQLIINSVLLWNEDIIQFLTSRTSIPVISLWKLLS